MTDVRLELATDLARGGGVVRSVGGRTHKTGVPARRYAGDERIASTNEKGKTDAYPTARREGAAHLQLIQGRDDRRADAQRIGRPLRSRFVAPSPRRRSGTSRLRRRAVRQGLTFDYAADAGDDYWPVLMVAHAGEFQVVQRVHDSQCPAVEVTDADGTLNQGMLRDAREYWRIKALVDAELARVGATRKAVQQ